MVQRKRSTLYFIFPTHLLQVTLGVLLPIAAILVCVVVAMGIAFRRLRRKAARVAKLPKAPGAGPATTLLVTE